MENPVYRPHSSSLRCHEFFRMRSGRWSSQLPAGHQQQDQQEELAALQAVRVVASLVAPLASLAAVDHASDAPANGSTVEGCGIASNARHEADNGAEAVSNGSVPAQHGRGCEQHSQLHDDILARVCGDLFPQVGCLCLSRHGCCI